MKTGYQNSMYANLMERFACLYTSHVSNLRLYSPYVKFQGRIDVMAHELGQAGKRSQGDERDVVKCVKRSTTSHVTSEGQCFAKSEQIPRCRNSDLDRTVK
jgi:hypothetical protein